MNLFESADYNQNEQDTHKFFNLEFLNFKLYKFKNLKIKEKVDDKV